MFPLRYLNSSAVDSLNQIFDTYAYTQMFIYTEIERISPVFFLLSPYKEHKIRSTLK